AIEVLAAAGAGDFRNVFIDGDEALESRYGIRVPVLGREAGGGELDWPFDVAAVRAFAGRGRRVGAWLRRAPAFADPRPGGSLGSREMGNTTRSPLGGLCAALLAAVAGLGAPLPVAAEGTPPARAGAPAEDASPAALRVPAI